MPNQNVARLAFNRGQVSPLALARTDIDRVELSAEEQTNFMPRVLGSMMNRPGLKYVDTTLSNNYAQHLPFVFSLDDKALIEFTNLSMRVRVDDAIIERSAVSTTTRGGDFSADVTNWNKLTDHSGLPSTGQDVAFNPEGNIAAYAHSNGGSRTLTCFSVSGTTFTALTNPTGGSTTANGTGVAFSPDGQLLACSHDGAAGFDVWAITGTGASATFTHLTTPALSAATSLAFSPDGDQLAVTTSGGNFITFYQISGSGLSATFTAITAPGTLPTGAGNDVSWSFNSRFVAVAHTTSPYLTLYERNGTTYTKIADPGTLPNANGNGVAFSPDANYLAVAHGTSRFVTIYSVATTGLLTKITDPGTLPTGSGNEVAWSSDNQFLVVGHATSPFITIYQNIAGVFTKLANPGTLPDDTANSVKFLPNNNVLSVTGATSPFHTIYQPYQWLDLDETGTSSTYGGVSPATFETAFTSTLNVAGWGIAGGASGVNVRQLISSGGLTRTGDRIKVTFQTLAGSTLTVNKCYIGKQASSGDAYDFASAPTQVTFDNGSASFTIGASSTKVSDEIVFDFDGSSIIIAFHMPSTGDEPASRADSSADLTPYYKQGADDTSTVNTTGYTSLAASKDVVGINKIEVVDNATGGSGLFFVGSLYNEAKRVQAVSVLNTDKTVEHALNIIVTQGEVTLRVGTGYGEEDLISKTKLTEGFHSLAFTPNSNLFFIQFSSNTQYSSILSQCQVAGSGDMTLDTVYEEADIGHLRYAQSADVVYIACPNKPQYKIERRGTHSWSIVKYLPPDGPFRGLNVDSTTLTASALSGDITVTASRDVFKEEHVGGLFKITSAGQNTNDNFTGANQFSATEIRVTGTGTQRSITIVRSGTWSATITLQRSASAPGNWVDVATFTTNGTTIYTDDLDNQIYYYRIGIKTGNYTSGTATVQLQYASGGIDGVVRITGFNSRTSVDAIVLKLLGSTSGSENWKEGLWSDVRGYPTAVALHEGRIVWAGKDRVVLSVADAYESFDEGVEGDSGPINRTIGLGPVDQINWIVSSKTLVLGGQDAEFSVGTTSFDEVLTPSNFHADPVTNVGSSEVMAMKLDKAVIFASRTGTKLYQLSYDSEIYDYKITDLSRLVPELCEAQIVKLFYQRYPDTRVHCVLDDGTVAVMVYESEEQVNCWLKIETDGLIEDCVVLPGDVGIPEDQVYYVVKRTINSVDVRYLERWALESECQGGTLNKQLDAFITYSGAPTTSITGLDHLEGETVRVWGDGAYQGSFTVSGGGITLSASVSAAVVGLSYEARYKSTKLAYAAAQGTALTKNKRVSQFGLICQNTHNGDTTNARGPRFGTDYNYCYNMPSEVNGAFVDEDYIHDQADLDMFAVSDTWTTDSRLCIIADAPYPITLLCITFNITTNG